MAASLIAAALSLNRTYQDSWILEGIWIPMMLLLAGYLICVIYLPSLRQVAVLAAITTFLLYVVPALKYWSPYGSTNDVAVHTASTRFLSVTGHVHPLSLYRQTPGLHAVVAALSQLSGVRSELWLKVMPAFLGSLAPLAFYMLCKRASLPDSLTRFTLFLSVLSLPLLYILNGTAYTVPLLVVLVVWVLLREMDTSDADSRIAYTVLLLLLAVTLVVWHPGTSLVAPLVLLAAGIPLALGSKNMLFLERSTRLVSLAVLSLVLAFSYWMYDADFVWTEFLRNFGLALQVEVTPELIPQRFFEISFGDRLLMSSFLHVRDALFLLFVALGMVLGLRYRRGEHFSRFLLTYGVICLLFVTVVFAPFLIGFGAQGYQRFMRQAVAVTPLLAGYGLWKGLQALQRSVPSLSGKRIIGVAMLVAFIISSVQLFPYQPAIPTLVDDSSDSLDAPLLWVHEVNTNYQYHMLRFALEQLPQGRQLIADYIGHRQSLMFFGYDAYLGVRRTVFQKPEPAYLLLHWPGQAGAYREQAEFRSTDAIEAWRGRPGMSTVYDNGGSFILYYPENALDPFALE
jgi:hypothetical protein